jgi:4'-phosphopantetheinyl transferase
MILESDAMHIWRARTTPSNADTSRLDRLLSSDERARASRFGDARARARFTLSRAALRTILARYAGCDAAALSFDYTKAGKPSVRAGGPGHGLRFSLSHAGEIALIAISRDHEIGVDVERVRQVGHAARIARRLFAAPTRAVLDHLDGAEADAAFVHAWTQREALVKTVGGGMYGTRDPLEFEWPRPGPSQVQHTGAEPHGIGAWTVAPLVPAEGYAATAVAAGIAQTIRLWTQPPTEEA